MGNCAASLGKFASWDEKTDTVDAENDSTHEICRYWNDGYFGIVFLPA